MKKKSRFRGSWTIIVMSGAEKRSLTFKIPKLLVASLLLMFFSISIGLFTTYNYADQLGQKNAELSKELEGKLSELTAIQEDQDSLILQAVKTQEKIEQLEQLENQMNVIVTSLDSNGMGGEEIKIEQLSLSDEADGQIKQYASIESRLPDLVKQYENTLAELETVQKDLTVIPSIWPTTANRISSDFGARHDPFTSVSAIHEGIDVAGPYGTPIFAAADGIVIYSARRGSYGNLIIIKHNNQYTTKYGHLNKSLVDVGDKVTKGQLIAEMGSTGRSTGPHLHYEIIKDGKNIDPMPYMIIRMKEN
ncbi:peptidoglycan DD-metalloendopeptidase family protein [Bacillaceae bacterium S4-13-58]